MFLQGPVTLIFDGSVIGKDSACLMASIIYKKRAIPIAWLVIEGRKGHFTEDYHLELLEIVRGIFPDDTNVIVIGDGEFDGVNFLETIAEFGWYFVVRTAKNSKITRDGDRIKLPKKLKPGQLKYWLGIDFTDEFYGPLTIVAWRPEDKKETFILVSNCLDPIKIKLIYKKRQVIETFFSDLKTRGFYLHKSHISDLGRLANLMIAGCIAYIWVVLLGKHALNIGENKIFHRTDRCDLSLLQLGFRYLEHLINEKLSFPKINFLDFG